MSESRNEFVVSRLIEAPREYVWRAWTNPKHLQQWWCPAPITCQVLKFDLRRGGAFDLQMTMPDGQIGSQSGAFLDIIEGERIIFTTALSEDWRPTLSPLPITGIISMSDEGQHTRYHTRVLYRDNEHRQQLEQMHFERGWNAATEQLAELVTIIT